MYCRVTPASAAISAANAILGAVFAVGVLAMAVAGSNSLGLSDAAIAANPKAPIIVTAD
jgi:hypothetical protein